MSVCSFCLVVPLQTLRSVEKVRMKGLEPPRPESLDPKSNAATNYATCAGFYVMQSYKLFPSCANVRCVWMVFFYLLLSCSQRAGCEINTFIKIF